MKILMCSPEFYGIEYEINPWMNKKIKTDHSLALSQWKKLQQIISDCGAKVELMPSVKGWPDMVFTANAGLVFDSKIILSHFKHKERQGETPYFKEWFLKAGYDIFIDPLKDKRIPAFEGAGDALFAGEKLFCGYGFRTDPHFYEEITFIPKEKMILCELVDPYFYHIDTCFCPLNEEQAIWYPEAFTKDSQQRIQDQIELIAVKEEEARHFACNAVVLDKNIILPKNCPEISTTLTNMGFTVHTTEMTEYIKAGGACKCLTLRLD